VANHRSDEQKSGNRPGGTIRRAFGDLRVRPKLVLLHNLFFLILTLSVYFSVIPVFEEKISAARDRELAMMSQLFRSEPAMANSGQGG